MTSVRTVHVHYHAEGASWWAESADVEGYTATAPSLTELRGLVREGLPFLLDDEAVTVVEDFPTIDPLWARVDVAAANMLVACSRGRDHLLAAGEFHQQAVSQGRDLASA